MQEDLNEEQPELEDAGHIILSCSSCRAQLLDIWRTRPHEQQIWKCRCNCPFCGDKSFIKEVKGGFYVGGIGKVKDDDEDDVIPSTNNVGCDIVSDVFEFQVEKASTNAKPIFTR